MNMIKGLIKKDLYNLSSYKTSLLIVIIFCGIAIIGTGNINFGPIIICTILGMISLSTFSYDEMSKSNKYILTLPTNRKEIIKAKYILAISFTILGGILGMILTVAIANIMNYIRPENLIEINYESLISTTIGGMFGISLIQAIQIPSIYKWGAEKGRVQMFILVFILTLLVLGVGYLIMNASFNISLETIENVMQKYGIILLIAIMGVMYYVSYKISNKIYKNKEDWRIFLYCDIIGTNIEQP